MGGTHVKVQATGQRARRKLPSGPGLDAHRMVRAVSDLIAGWSYEVVSIGVPTRVRRGRIVAEPANLGRGWVAFDFARAFDRPVRLINDAAMQALGAYEGGRMLFLGFGTGLGTALIVDGAIVPMELAHLPYKKGTYEDYVGLRGLERNGKKRWRRDVADVVGATVRRARGRGSGPRRRQLQAPEGPPQGRAAVHERRRDQGRFPPLDRAHRPEVAAALPSEIVAGIPELLAEIDAQLVVDELVVVDRLAGLLVDRLDGDDGQRRSSSSPGSRWAASRGRSRSGASPTWS